MCPGPGKELGLSRCGEVLPFDLGGWSLITVDVMCSKFTGTGASLGPVYTQKKTKAWQVWGPLTVCSEQPRLPQAHAQSCGGAAGGTRWAGRWRKAHSSPCADGPRRALAAPHPTPKAPSSSAERSWRGGRMAGCRCRWSFAVAMGRERSSANEQFPCLNSRRGPEPLVRDWGPVPFPATTSLTNTVSQNLGDSFGGG